LKNNRLHYFSALFITLILGVLSRKITDIPLFIGDVLYAVLIYFGLRLLFIHLKTHKTFLLSLLFCFGIEILQLVQIDWLIAIRKTTLGHYILGQGFLWSDLLCYIIGTLVAFLIDWKFIKTQNLNSL
jgi:Zn-dependent protease with chaperone function